MYQEGRKRDSLTCPSSRICVDLKWGQIRQAFLSRQRRIIFAGAGSRSSPCAQSRGHHGFEPQFVSCETVHPSLCCRDNKRGCTGGAALQKSWRKRDSLTCPSSRICVDLKWGQIRQAFLSRQGRIIFAEAGSRSSPCARSRDHHGF